MIKRMRRRLLKKTLMENLLIFLVFAFFKFKLKYFNYQQYVSLQVSIWILNAESNLNGVEFKPRFLWRLKLVNKNCIERNPWESCLSTGPVCVQLCPTVQSWPGSRAMQAQTHQLDHQHLLHLHHLLLLLLHFQISCFAADSASLPTRIEKQPPVSIPDTPLQSWS